MRGVATREIEEQIVGVNTVVKITARSDIGGFRRKERKLGRGKTKCLGRVEEIKE